MTPNLAILSPVSFVSTYTKADWHLHIILKCVRVRIEDYPDQKDEIEAHQEVLNLVPPVPGHPCSGVASHPLKETCTAAPESLVNTGIMQVLDTAPERVRSIIPKEQVARF